MSKVARITVIAVAGLLLWGIVLSSTALADVGLGGKINANHFATIEGDGDWAILFMYQTNLKLLLPDYGDTSAKFEMDINYVLMDSTPQLSMEIKKMYIKQRFEYLHVTAGRQPISWSFGSLINPGDYAGGLNWLETGSGLDAQKSSDGVSVYYPINWNSSMTLVLTDGERSNNPRVGARARTNLYGLDLAASYVRNPNTRKDTSEGSVQVPPIHRLAVTGKGDVGPVAVYGAVGYNFADQDVPGGLPVYLLGVDYSYPLGYGSKVLAQVEYLRDEAGVVQWNPFTGKSYGEDLLVGMLGYEIDQFSSASLMAVVNPGDASLLVAPVYKNQLGSNLDLTVQAGLFFGDEGTQFGPRETRFGLGIPRGMLQVSLGYPF